MMDVGINHYIFLSAVIMGFGLYTVIAHKNIVRMMAGIVMVFTASVINLAAFSSIKGFNPEGQVMIFLIAAVCFVILITGIMLAYNYYRTANSTETADD